MASEGTSGAAPVGRAIPFRLTRREQDVLERLTTGRTNREIATDLFISEKTASVHLSNIKSKLGANGRAKIAAIAVRLASSPKPRADMSWRERWPAPHPCQRVDPRPVDDRRPVKTRPPVPAVRRSGAIVIRAEE